jgi:hypothetical protein
VLFGVCGFITHVIPPCFFISKGYTIKVGLRFW